jgi:hypothetical protein
MVEHQGRRLRKPKHRCHPHPSPETQGARGVIDKLNRLAPSLTATAMRAQ